MPSNRTIKVDRAKPSSQPLLSYLSNPDQLSNLQFIYQDIPRARWKQFASSYSQIAKYPTTPVKAHAALNAINTLLKSLLFLIASLYSVIKGICALAFQYPEIYMDVNISAATLTNAKISGLIARKMSARALMSDKNACRGD